MSVPRETTLDDLRGHFTLDEGVWAKVEAYIGLLATEARRLGLVGFAPGAAAGEVARSLVIDELLEAGPLADVGSGGGLPGVPLGIVRGGATLVEARRRAVGFLEMVSRRLDVPFEVVPFPVETFARGPGRGRFAAVTARAVAPAAVALEMCAPLASIGGRVAVTAAEAAQPLRLSRGALRLLGVSAPRVRRLQGPGDIHVVVHIVKKLGVTDESLPRNLREARRRPLD